MKRAVVGLAALGVLFAMPAMAADLSVMPIKAPPQPALTPSGYIDLYTGAGRITDEYCTAGYGCGSDSVDGWAFGGAGRGNWWLTKTLSLQFDAQAEGTQYKVPNCPNCGDKLSTNSYDLAAHFAWRDPRYAVGVLGAVSDLSPGMRDAAFGAEGLGNWGMFTLYAQGGYATTVGQNLVFGADIDGGFARGTLRIYPRQTILLEGTIMGAWLTGSPFDSAHNAAADIRATIWRVKAETMVNRWLSIYAAYQGSHTELSAGAPPQCCNRAYNDTEKDSEFLVGIRAWLNRDNLRNNDITGAPFDFINPLGFLRGFLGGA